MRNLLPIAFLALAPLAQAADPPSTLPESGPLPEVRDSGMGYETPQAALDGLKAKVGVRIHEEGGWTIAEDQESEKVFALWSFTPKEHPAHPAAKEACDALVRDFQALNDRIVKDVQSHAP